jgi:hypothetical protein
LEQNTTLSLKLTTSKRMMDEIEAVFPEFEKNIHQPLALRVTMKKDFSLTLYVMVRLLGESPRTKQNLLPVKKIISLPIKIENLQHIIKEFTFSIDFQSIAFQTKSNN